MSSWRKASKINQKTHRERHQPEARKHLGILEKHSDYKKRAEDFQQKRQTLTLLKKRAQNRNPDEFYHHMINSEVKGGIHKEKTKDEDTPEQTKLMQTQDLKYVTYKRTIEMKKIEKLQSELHLIDAANSIKNNHIIFMDNDTDVRHFDLAKRLNTHPDLMNNKINRPDVTTLGKVHVDADNLSPHCNDIKLQKYKELKKRILRKNELTIIQDKLELRKHLAQQNCSKPKKIKRATKTRAAKYLWSYERKK